MFWFSNSTVHFKLFQLNSKLKWVSSIELIKLIKLAIKNMNILEIVKIVM